MQSPRGSGTLIITSMSSHSVRALLAPPNVGSSNTKTISRLNTTLRTLEDLNNLEVVVSEEQRKNEELQSRVRLPWYS